MRQSINATFYTIIGRTLCLLFAALLVSGFELYTRPGFQLASAVNSLSQSSVLCMTQDSVGFLWIGTKDGLNRFDGYEFVTYKYDRDNINSLSSNEISCLVIQNNRWLWIGTRSGGINRLEFATGAITRFSGLTYDDQVRDLYIDSEGQLWAGTAEGLLKYDYDKERFVNITGSIVYRNENNEVFSPSRQNLSIVSIYQHEPTKLLLGAENGLFEFDFKEHTSFRSVVLPNRNQSVFTKIRRDSKGQLWASSYDGLMLLRKNNKRSGYDIEYYNENAPAPRTLPVDWVQDFIEDKDGNMWLATRGSGLLRMVDGNIADVFDNTIGRDATMPDNLVNSLFIDRTGVLWIGTENKGLCCLDLYAKKFRSIIQEAGGLSDNLVTALTGGQSVLYAGTASSGIDIFRIEGKRFYKLGNIPRVVIGAGRWKKEVSALCLDSDSNLWIGTATNRLVVLNRNGSSDSYVVNGFVFSLLEDKEGRIWFGTWGQGFGYIDKRTRNIVQYYDTPITVLGLESDKVIALLIDSHGLLWVGTKGGGLSVARIDDILQRRVRFRTFMHDPEDETSLAYNDVYGIREDREGRIWIATGKGLNMLDHETVGNVLDSKVVFQHIGEDDELLGGLVYSILEDNSGHLWIGTNRGLCRYSHKGGKVVNYDSNDGLPCSGFKPNSAFLNPHTGEMLFGGVDGIAIFHPDSIENNPFDAKVAITGMRLHNNIVLPMQKANGRSILDINIFFKDTISLAYSDNEVSFEFSAFHFSSPEKVRYAYRLVGFNDTWQEISGRNRRINYTNLKPGKYTLQIKATNNDGVWSPHVCELHINVAPPFWLTPWAYGVYAILMLILLIIFRKYSVIAVKKKNQLIIESIKHKKETELSEAKMRFFTNVSHEIRTPLTLIHSPLKQLLDRGDLDWEIKRSLLLIYRNVKRLMVQVNQLLDLRKMDKGEFTVRKSVFALDTLIREAIVDFESLITKNHIKIDFRNNVADSRIKSDRNLVETIVHNLVSNALKFSPVNSTVTISIERQEKESGDDVLILKVRDEGPGIPEDTINSVFDRFYQVKRNAFEHLGGSGLGLAIVKEFVEKLGGEVMVQNQVDKGCCFTVVLPPGDLSEAEKLTADEPVVREEFDAVVLDENYSVSGGNQVLMIVEDDADLAAYLSSVFSRKFKVHVFDDGDKAAAEVRDLIPDLIICDIMLPGMNGIDFTKLVKTNQETSHIPVIMLTARAGDEDKFAGFQVGADAYIVKPFSINVLEAQVASILKSRQAFRTKFSKQLTLEPGQEVITPSDEKFLRRLLEITEKYMSDPSFDVAILVDEMGMSHSKILKKIKALTGLSLVEFIRSMRIKKAVQIFSQDKLSVSEVAFMVGFSDPKYFGKCFAKEIGMKPTDFIKQYHE